ncbi:SCO family protein [Ideonella sp. 4Y11]|uniref:SCO family protein n=1 Tax=Ideonella aquatica TaxID=2824119 RepID=A0A941BK41_9BURK|nr:SCO family protein [Ideonella aquatica]MBQ0960132.1 SCO family protein [Ideonella aquatica]
MPTLSPSIRRAGVAAALLLAALAAAAIAWFRPAPAPALGAIDLSDARYAQDFRLQDPQGEWRTLADYRGRVVMLFFGFTQCPDVCPAAMAKAVQARQQLGAQADQVQLVFVSLDPERDSGPILRAFADAFGEGITPLRGDVDLTRRTAEAFKVFYRKVPLAGSYTLDHSVMVYLYDRQGRVRRALPPTLDAAGQAAELRTVLSLS